MVATLSTDNAQRALLERLIDDASLFPPARLAMAHALRAHARHAESAYRWVGGRFVVPASRADEFAAAYGGGAIELAVVLDAGALGSKGDTVRADLARVAALRDLPGVTVGAFEARLPRLTLDAAALARIVDDLTAHAGGAPVAFWYEAGYDGGWSVAPAHWLGVLSAARAAAPANVGLGAKVRCGGAGTTPSIDDLAAFLTAAHEHGVPWKATAGLHDPIASGDAAGSFRHGFLNVFVAGALLHAGVIGSDRVADVLAERDPRAFAVDPSRVAWRGAALDAPAIGAARERCVAFGSCSFADPVNGLRELGILL